MSIFSSKGEKEKALKLLCDVINKVTVNPKGRERALANYIATYLEDTDCSIEIEEFAKDRANVFGKIKGREKGNALMLNGHLDTVPFGNLEEWRTPPDRATIENDILYGRGASDMKGGLCAALFAFHQLALEGSQPEHDIVFLGTGDEESMGLGAREAIKCGVLDDVGRIIIGEPTGNKISVASKGTLWLEFTIKGRTCHGAYPWEGVNAADIAYRLHNDIASVIDGYVHEYLSKPTCTITKIKAGMKENMVPDNCTLVLDTRTVPDIDHRELLSSVDKIIENLKEMYKGLVVEYNILNNRMAVGIDPEHSLVQELSQSIEKVSGSKHELTGTGFFSDASIFLREYNIPTVLFGPGESSEAHKPNEKLHLDKYFEAVECYYDFLKKQ